VIRVEYGAGGVRRGLQWRAVSGSGREEDPNVQVRGERERVAVQLLEAIDELGRAYEVTYIAGVVDEVDEKTIIDCTACGLQAAMVRSRGLRWEQQETATERPKRTHHLQVRCHEECTRFTFIRLARPAFACDLMMGAAALQQCAAAAAACLLLLLLLMMMRMWNH
jgi:hypothetical protein